MDNQLPASHQATMVAAASAARTLASATARTINTSSDDFDPATLSPGQLATYNRQQAWLLAFAQPVNGNIRAACLASNVGRETADWWIAKDYLGMKARLQSAAIQHREALESKVLGAIHEASNKELMNHPVLPIFALKGAWPDKYGDKVQVVDSDAREILHNLKAWQRARRSGIIEVVKSDEKLPSATGLDVGNPSLDTGNQ